MIMQDEVEEARKDPVDRFDSVFGINPDLCIPKLTLVSRIIDRDGPVEILIN